MRLMTGRWPAAATALAGVGLALPSVSAPTWQQTIAARELGDVVAVQLRYSWGRVEFEGPSGVPLGSTENRTALVGFVVLLVVAAAAALAWLLLPRRLAVLGPVGVALLTGRLAGTAAERHGRVLAPETRPGPGLSYVTGSTEAGWYETVALVVLVVALGLMALALVRTPPPDPGSPPAHLDAPPVSFSETGQGTREPRAEDSPRAEGRPDAEDHPGVEGGRRGTALTRAEPRP